MITGKQLVAVIKQSPLIQYSTLDDLKKDIKRRAVDPDDVPYYISCLLQHFSTPELQTLAFTTLCHLIKRLERQDFNLLTNHIDQLAPFLFAKFRDQTKGITAQKTLRSLWILHYNDDRFAALVHDYGLNSVDSYIRKITLSLLADIMRLDGFLFKRYMRDLVLMLDEASDVLIQFCNNVKPGNIAVRNDLIALMIELDIGESGINLLKKIDENLVGEYQSLINQQEFAENSMAEINTGEINDLLNAIPYWKSEDLEPMADNVDKFLEKIASSFDGKETEQNWKMRQDAIIAMRRFIRGSSVSQCSLLLKGAKYFIQKGLVSLRTTLSNNSCQLCKEAGIYLGHALDIGTVEFLLAVLIRLCSSRKSLQHQNANVGVIGLLLSSEITLKIATLVQEAATGKNSQPKVYVGDWIKLLVIKGEYSLVGLLTKGISDSQPNVRTSMRSAFLTLERVQPELAYEIKSVLDSATLRALERANGKANINLPDYKFNVDRSNIRNTRDYLSPPTEEKQRRSISLGGTEPKLRSTQRVKSYHAGIVNESPNFNEEPIKLGDSGQHNTDVEILSMLCSDFTDSQTDAINYILKESQVSYKIRTALNTLSITNAIAFSEVFCSPTLFEKLTSILSIETILRIYAICSSKVSVFGPKVIVESFKPEELAFAVTTVLGYCSDASKLDDIRLNIQYLRYKSIIMGCMLELSINLLSCVKGYWSTDLLNTLSICEGITGWDNLKQLMHSLGYDENNQKNEITNTSKSFSLNEEDEEVDFGALENMTRVIPKFNSELVFANAEKINEDALTKIIPKVDVRAVFDDVEIYQNNRTKEKNQQEKEKDNEQRQMQELAQTDTLRINCEQQDQIMSDGILTEINQNQVDKVLKAKGVLSHEQVDEGKENYEMIENDNENSNRKSEPATPSPTGEIEPDLDMLDINNSTTDEGIFPFIDNYKQEIRLDHTYYTDYMALDFETLLHKIESAHEKAPLLIILEDHYRTMKIEIIWKVFTLCSEGIEGEIVRELMRKYEFNDVNVILSGKYHHWGKSHKILVLDRLLEIISDGKFSIEDIFLMDRVLVKSVIEEDPLLRWKTMLLYKKLWGIYQDEVKDENGYQLVDEFIFKNIDMDLLHNM